MNIGALVLQKEVAWLKDEQEETGKKDSGKKNGSKEEKEKLEFATVQVPSVLPRVVFLPDGKKGQRCAILLEQMIERNIDKLFVNYDVVCAHPYRIMRNADLTIEEMKRRIFSRDPEASEETPVGRGDPPGD